MLTETAPAVAAPMASATAQEVAVERYVVRVYRDLFGRAPDPTGLGTWRAAILDGRPRVEVANAITSSHEYRTRLVTGTYERFLDRGPDAVGLSNWVDALASGWTVSHVSAGFLASDEHYQQAGSTRAGWVVRLYDDVLGRTPGQSEVDFWVRELARGASRWDVSLGFLLSWEHLSTVVDGYYEQLLGRHLDPTGQRTWVSALQGGVHDEEIIGGIIASAEYWNTATAATPASVVVSVRPERATAGQPVAVTVTSHDVLGSLLADVTGEAVLTVDGSGAWCVRASCTIPEAGPQVIEASWRGLTASVPVVVDAGPAASLTVTPATASVADGASVVFSAAGRDAFGNAGADLTAQADFAVDGNPAACVGARCRPVGAGAHQVTASLTSSPAVTGSATIQVAAPGPVRYRAFEWGGYGQDRPGYVDGGVLGATAQWAAVSVSTSHTLGIKTDGSLWSWGDNRLGQLGDGTTTDRELPEPLGTRTDWASVSAGDEFSLAVAKDGTLWAWGYASQGHPGDATTVRWSPERIGTSTDWASAVASGGFAVATKRDGSLWAWGDNYAGQLGDGTTTDRVAPARVGTGTWSSVAVGFDHVVGIASDGTLWAWGVRSRRGMVTESALSPVQLGTANDWRTVAAGYEVSGAIRADGSLWTWGTSASTELLGDGSTAGRVDPVQVGAGTSWTSVSFGYEHAVALDSAGGLWRWGVPELAPHGSAGVPLPARVGTDTGWTSASAGYGYTIALRP
ncbi:DUF4214 domain-containing protein [Cellulomonas fengjieae]|uniref:DUF4214 domain-containing protein n=1 Tax=Cellulomonas fengjieae TaxID=2819978 RepID=UPI001AAED654|nr:DUF4214 domain-containing protein [Cellulomonas fengjieae]MBO3101928.1 DUF4214 domain-containing protein [Cellulomonas fengjieae]